jgi:hypothetical protein
MSLVCNKAAGEKALFLTKESIDIFPVLDGPLIGIATPIYIFIY